LTPWITAEPQLGGYGNAVLIGRATAALWAAAALAAAAFIDETTTACRYIERRATPA